MPVFSSTISDKSQEIINSGNELLNLSVLNTESNENTSATTFTDDDIEAMVKDILYDIPFEKSYFINKGLIEIRFSSIPAEKADAIYRFIADQYKNMPEIIIKNELMSWRVAQSLVYIKGLNITKYNKLDLPHDVEQSGLINPTWLKKAVIKSENAWRVICGLYEQFSLLEEKLRKELISENFFISPQLATK